MHSDTCRSCEENEAERPDWGEGPWQNEPNYVPAFRHASLLCLLHRGGSGAWCGYVGVEPEHPVHGLDYNAVHELLPNLEVHGGLTYSEQCAGHICHVPEPGETDDVWWLGFDCNHSGDLAPSAAATGRKYGLSLPGFPGDRYRTMEYCRRETMRLAEQLTAARAAKKKPEKVTA